MRPLVASSLFHYKGQKSGLIELQHSERPGFLEFRSRLEAHDHPSSFSADGARDFCAEGLECLGSGLSAHALEGPGNHISVSGKWLRLRGFAVGDYVFHQDAVLGEPIDQFAIALLVEEGPYGCRDDLPDVWNRLQLAKRGLTEPGHRRERPGQRSGPSFSDVANADSMEDPPEIRLPAGVDLAHQVRRRLLPHSFQACELVDRELVQAGLVADQSLGDELVDQRLSETFDVHRAPRREVLQAAPNPGRAGSVLATPHHLVVRLDQPASAKRARRRHQPGIISGGVVLQNRADDFRNDVAALFDHDHVAVTDVAPLYLLL